MIDALLSIASGFAGGFVGGFVAVILFAIWEYYRCSRD